MQGVIYLYRNQINNKIYIGLTLNLKSRLSRHKNTKCNTYFSRAIQKYGWDAFECIILEEVSASSREEVKEKLNNLEIKYIALYNSTDPTIGYNITYGGGGVLGTAHTEEWKLNMSNKMFGHILSEETKLKISIANKGRKSPQKGVTASKESRLKMSESKKGNTYCIGRTYSNESLKKMSDSHRQRFIDSLEVTVEDICKYYLEGHSKVQTAKFAKCSVKGITNILKQQGIKISKSGFLERSISLYTLDYKYIRSFKSITEAANWIRSHHISNSKNISSSIGHCLRGDKTRMYGYIWRYNEK